MMTFGTEQALVDCLVDLIRADQTPWGGVQFTTEFDYARGRTDVVVLAESSVLIAIEAKLTKWRSALDQAYRNTCFADRSFVLLPKATAMAAANAGAEFEVRGVGICYIESGRLVVVKDSPLGVPVEPWLSSVARTQVGCQ